MSNGVNKKLLFILTGSILTLALLVFFAATGWDYFVGKEMPQTITQGTHSKCGDGTCDEIEKANPNLCPKDCKGQTEEKTCKNLCGDGTCQEVVCLAIGCPCAETAESCPKDCKTTATKTCSEQGGTICSLNQTCSGSWVDASDTDKCCGGKCEVITSPVTDEEDSPFGFCDPPNKGYAHYKDLGIKWLEAPKENTRFGWESVEKEKSKYDFANQDAEICTPYQNGINVIYVTRPANILYGTYWNEFGKSKEYPDNNEEEFLSAWSNYIKAVVERYDGDGVNDAQCSSKISIKYYQLVHELNQSDNYWAKNPEKYAKVLKKTYDAIKLQCSECKLAMAVPVPEDLSAFESVLSYLQNQDIQEIGFDFHIFRSNIKDTGDPLSSKGEFYRERVEFMDKIKKVASQYGFNNIYITSTESSLAGPQELEFEQAGYVIRSYVASLANGQKKLFWTKVVEYQASDESIWAHTGLINNPLNSDGLSHKKLAYYTYKLMVEKLDGSDWENIETVIDGKDNIYAYKFTLRPSSGQAKQGKPVWVVWWDYFNDTGTAKTVSLNVGNINSVKITEAIPKYESGKEVIDYNTAFETEIKSVQDGKISITLGDTPVFIEEQ